MGGIIQVLWKPLTGCLFTHQPAWNYEATDKDGDIYSCLSCRNYFHYPTKKLKPPIYNKD